MIFWACFRFAGDYFRFEPIYIIEAIEALNEYPVSYKFRFIGVFDVSEANRIPKPRLCGATRLVAGLTEPPVEIQNYWNPVENGGDRIAVE